MTSAAALERLRHGLREAVRQRGLTLAQASKKLRHHPHYLSRCLAGTLDLKVREVFELLALLGVDAEDFLAGLFPFASPVAVHAPTVKSQAGEDLQRLIRKERAQRGEDLTSPVAVTAKARRTLSGLIRRRRLKQKEVSARMGVALRYLTAALYGTKRLTSETLFQALEAIEVEPGRFFLELYGPPDQQLVAQLTWSAHLDEIEEVLRFLKGR